MREMENREVGQIRFQFTDGTWFVLDQMSLKHVNSESKMKLDFAVSEVFEQIEEAREKAEQIQKENENFHLGIDVKEDINSKDKFGG